jgi:hypothetical protein
MPNHITNRLIIKAEGEKLQQILERIKGCEPNQHIDFNKIVPMPDALEIENSGAGDTGMEYILLKAKRFRCSKESAEVAERFNGMSKGQQKEALALGKRYLLNIAYFGHTTWYGWCVENWGTKWNAYDQTLKNGNEVWFTTAWSGATNLICSLSKVFPDVEFEYSYADEDTGCNTGAGSILNGIATMRFPDNYSSEAYELCFELIPENKEYYKLTDSGYEYIEED